MERRFTSPGVHPFDEVEWEIRDAVIGDPENPAFEQREVEFPKSWSQNATNIVAQKYFRGKLGSPERERSVKQMISRVAGTIAGWGREGGYFASDEDADAFEAELTHILLHQKAAFNSPVWFNVGWREEGEAAVLGLLHPLGRGHDGVDPRLEHPGGDHLQGRLRIRDQPLEDPRLDGAARQGRDRLRPGQLHARRRLLGGRDQERRRDPPGGEDGGARRRPPGHRGLHLVQGARGGEGRGAARRPASTCGWTPSVRPIQYQNANNSVRVSDEFMQAVEEDGDWELTARVDGRAIKTVKARELMRQIADAAWRCADPGVQYDTTINRWHTCPESGDTLDRELRWDVGMSKSKAAS